MRLVEIYNELKEKVVFFCVYIKEAHPLDGWVLPVNTAESIEVQSPSSIEERAQIASACMLRYDFPFTMLIDNINDEAEEKYRSEPDRLYVIDKEGKVAWKSDLGPFYFDVESWQKEIKSLI